MATRSRSLIAVLAVSAAASVLWMSLERDPRHEATRPRAGAHASPTAADEGHFDPRPNGPRSVPPRVTIFGLPEDRAGNADRAQAAARSDGTPRVRPPQSAPRASSPSRPRPVPPRVVSRSENAPAPTGSPTISARAANPGASPDSARRHGAAPENSDATLPNGVSSADDGIAAASAGGDGAPSAPSSSVAATGTPSHARGESAGVGQTPARTPPPAPPPAPGGRAPTLLAPRPIVQPLPGYPEPLLTIERGGLSAAARMGAPQGRVRLRVYVRADGTVASVDVVASTGSPELDAAAASSLSRWRFVPAIRDGVPIDAYYTLWVSFRLE